MRELSVTEQRYKAVLAVIAEGRTVTQVARDWDVARQTVHVWLERYEADGLEGLANRSHRPAHCPHQMPAAVEAQLLEMRRAKPFWGARRLALASRASTGTVIHGIPVGSALRAVIEEQLPMAVMSE